MIINFAYTFPASSHPPPHSPTSKGGRRTKQKERRNNGRGKGGEWGKEGCRSLHVHFLEVLIASFCATGTTIFDLISSLSYTLIDIMDILFHIQMGPRETNNLKWVHLVFVLHFCMLLWVLQSGIENEFIANLFHLVYKWNEKAEDDAHASLKEADKYCKLILGRLSKGHGCLKGVFFASVALVAGAAIMSQNVQSLDLDKLSSMFNLS